MQKKDTSEKYFHSKYFEVFYPKENKKHGQNTVPRIYLSLVLQIVDLKYYNRNPVCQYSITSEKQKQRN